jgi:DNA-binding NarL/FixJ family response regulator
MKVHKVFLVDDHPIFRQGIKRLLRYEDFYEYAGEAENGKDALLIFKKIKPDIVLVDIEMPEMDGPTLIRLMKDSHMNAKVIVLSQASEDKRLKELLEIGVDGHVLKSEESSQILKALKAVSSGEKFFSPKVASKFYNLLHGSLHASVAQNVSSAPVSVAVSSSDVSNREMQVARLVAGGHTNKEIARLLSCSENTIKSHKANIMRKIGAKNSVEISNWVNKK